MAIPGPIAGGIQDYLSTNGVTGDIMGGAYDRPQAPISPQEAASATGSFGPSIGGLPGSIGGGRELSAPAAGPGPDGSEGIGLMGTLGILNMGAGLGGSIFKMVQMANRPKPRKRMAAVPGPRGNPMR